MLSLDTLAISRRFTSAGLTEEQADVLTETFRESQEQSFEQLTTKQDLEHVYKNLQKDIESKASKEDIQNLSLEIAVLREENKLTRWILVFLLAGVTSLIFKLYFGT